jgi:hypothetical protein
MSTHQISLDDFKGKDQRMHLMLAHGDSLTGQKRLFLIFECGNVYYEIIRYIDGDKQPTIEEISFFTAAIDYYNSI